MENIIVEFDESGERHVIRGVETIGDLKNRIQQEYQIDADEQILQYQEYLMFDNDKKIASLRDIKTHKKMTLYNKIDHQTAVQVDVVCQGAAATGKECTIRAFGGQTVSMLKEQINKKLGFGPYLQSLTTFRKPMKDEDLLRDYIISERPTVSCTIANEGVPRNYVFVQYKNKQESFPVAQKDTIYTVEYKFREKHNLPEDYNIYFTWMGQQLLGFKTLKEYSIPDNGVLGFSEYPII
ncbi:hypothetical protein AQUCO_03400109v1 [Aquilegia coerulea]|uniref:Ubiquitin-like domain-containing protein n=1 Tax=Aquilegia coerulea TaxID=218851 RepID=A0A2G5CXI7_AQUCA|nr:hypothetical protein AQUCO_03400109v1 [Aquilegia coerulea]